MSAVPIPLRQPIAPFRCRSAASAGFRESVLPRLAVAVRLLLLGVIGVLLVVASGHRVPPCRLPAAGLRLLGAGPRPRGAGLRGLRPLLVALSGRRALLRCSGPLRLGGAGARRRLGGAGARPRLGGAG